MFKWTNTEHYVIKIRSIALITQLSLIQMNCLTLTMDINQQLNVDFVFLELVLNMI